MSDVILKNKDGQDVTYTGIIKLTVPKVGGGTATFTEGGSTISVINTNTMFWDSDETPGLLCIYLPDSVTSTNYAFSFTITNYYTIVGNGISTDSYCSCSIASDDGNGVFENNHIELTRLDDGSIEIRDSDGLLEEWFGSSRIFDLPVKLLVLQ